MDIHAEDIFNDAADLLKAGAAAERARIREELLAEMRRSYESLFTGTSFDATMVQAVPVSDLIAALDQICPEEE